MTKQNKPSYQELHDELETLLEELQREDLDIDLAMEKYERGLSIIKQLETYLDSAENSVTEIKSKFSA